MISYHPTAKDAISATSGFKLKFDLSSVITSCIWAGVGWAGGRRKESNFLFSDWCVLDFDSGQMTLSEAIRNWCDCAHVIGTTKSHMIPKNGVTCDRFRVAIPWETRITDIKTYRYNMLKLTETYPIDSQCKDGARLFFPCTAVISQSKDGYKQEVSAVPAGWGKLQEVNKDIVGSGYIPSHVRRWVDNPAKPGTIRATYFKIGAELHKYGFELDDSVRIVSSGRVYDNATAADPLKELRECVSNGWYKDASNG